MSEQLWAIHVEGPDDILAQPDRATADAGAAETNRAYEEFTKRLGASELDGRWHAKVIPWDGTAEEHAEALAELANDPAGF